MYRRDRGGGWDFSYLVGSTSLLDNDTAAEHSSGRVYSVFQSRRNAVYIIVARPEFLPGEQQRCVCVRSVQKSARTAVFVTKVYREAGVIGHNMTHEQDTDRQGNTRIILIRWF